MREGASMNAVQKFLCVSAVTLLGTTAMAQVDTTQSYPTLNTGQTKVVEVSRVFDPWISDAGKVNFLPQLDDTVIATPKFEYHLLARPLVRLLPLRPIPPAKMGKERVGKLSPFYAKLGFGNNTSPLAELYYSGGRSEMLTYSVSAKHISSWGKLDLDEVKNVSVPFSSTDVAAHLRGTHRRNKFSYHIGAFYRHGYSSFYGAGDSLTRPVDSLWNETLSRHKGGFEFDLGSTHLDSSHFQYRVSGALEGYSDNYDNGEFHARAALEGYKDFEGQRYGGKFQVGHYGLSLGETRYPNTVVSFAPWLKLYGERWRVIAGVNLLYDANDVQSDLHIYPKGHVSYDIVRQYFIPYFELDGRLETADRWSVTQENPYLDPRVKVWNTSRNMEMRFGVKGRFTSRFGFNFYGEYALVDSMRFSVNGIGRREVSPGHYQSGLIAPMRSVYDRVAETHLRGELYYALSTRFSAGVRAYYWSYTLIRQAEPWHKPAWGGTLYANYNLRDKIYAGIDFTVFGGRKASSATGEAIELPIDYELNLQLRYRLNKGFSLFTDFRNLLFQRSYSYNLYPRHRLQAYLGIILEF